MIKITYRTLGNQTATVYADSIIQSPHLKDARGLCLGGICYDVNASDIIEVTQSRKKRKARKAKAA